MDRPAPTTAIPLAPVAVMLPELFTEARAPDAKIAVLPPFAEIVPVLPLVTVIGAPAAIVPTIGLLAVMVPVLEVTVMPPVPPDIVPALLTAMVPPLMAAPLTSVAVIWPLVLLVIFAAPLVLMPPAPVMMPELAVTFTSPTALMPSEVPLTVPALDSVTPTAPTLAKMPSPV